MFADMVNKSTVSIDDPYTTLSAMDFILLVSSYSVVRNDTILGVKNPPPSAFEGRVEIATLVNLQLGV